MAKHTPNAPRPTLQEAKEMLAELGWTPSEGSWEDDSSARVFAFARESCPGTYGQTAAAVSWSPNGGWLSIPDRKPTGQWFV